MKIAGDACCDKDADVGAMAGTCRALSCCSRASSHVVDLWNYDKMPVAFMYCIKSSKLNCDHNGVNGIGRH